jgi:hypothetical protein
VPLSQKQWPNGGRVHTSLKRINRTIPTKSPPNLGTMEGADESGAVFVIMFGPRTILPNRSSEIVCFDDDRKFRGPNDAEKITAANSRKNTNQETVD